MVALELMSGNSPPPSYTLLPAEEWDFPPAEVLLPEPELARRVVGVIVNYLATPYVVFSQKMTGTERRNFMGSLDASVQVMMNQNALRSNRIGAACNGALMLLEDAPPALPERQRGELRSYFESVNSFVRADTTGLDGTAHSFFDELSPEKQVAYGREIKVHLAQLLQGYAQRM